MKNPPAELEGPNVAIGRRPTGPDARVVGRASVADAQAEARRLSDGTWILRDCGVGSGTWVEGRPISTAHLAEGESFVIGGELFRVGEQTIEAVAPGRGLPVTFRNVVAKYPRSSEHALADVSFDHHSGLLAVVGPSGAGKSSSLKALLGDLDIISGQLSVGPANLADTASIDFIRAHAAYVPQSDHLQATLRVHELLDISARLRQAADTPQRERRAKIDEIVRLLGLEQAIDKPITTLSGGQKKRVSVAMELLGDPALLLLDEPTSGLDPGKDRQLMELFSRIAEFGCTVVVVTHSTQNLDLADATLIVRRGGSPVYCGPSEEALSALGVASWSVLMCQLDEDPDAFGAVAPGPRTGPGSLSLEAEGVSPQLPPLLPLIEREVRSLFRRGFASLGGLLITPVIGAGLAALASSDGLSVGPSGSNRELSMALAMLVIVCALGGVALTYNDIVAQRAVLRRDWRVGVEPGQMIAAKSIVFGSLAIVLGSLTTVTFVVLRPNPETSALGLPPTVLLGLILCLVYTASMALGMVISTWARSLEQAVAASTAVAVAQVSLCGILFAVPDVVNLVTVGIPSRWGTAALASSLQLNEARSGFAHTDALWESGDQFVASWSIILVLQIAAHLAIAREGLKRTLRRGS